MKQPCYRITVYHESRNLLEVWFEHLRSVGVPSAMVAHGGGKLFSVWRTGQEHITVRDYGNDEVLSGEIAAECNGFSKAVFEVVS